LVDCDLRSPNVSTALGVQSRPGLVDILAGHRNLNDVRTDVHALAIIPAGASSDEAAELLGSSRMVSLLRELESEFDAVIIDSPPLLPFPDAAVVARQCSATVIAVRSGKTRATDLDQAIRALRTVNAKVAGAVLTMTPGRNQLIRRILPSRRDVTDSDQKLKRLPEMSAPVAEFQHSFGSSRRIQS
jgi:succinoglycan biosynthesis transport protein ExoP